MPTITISTIDSEPREVPAYVCGDFYVHRTLTRDGFDDHTWSITPKNSQHSAGQHYRTRRDAKRACGQLSAVPDTDWTGVTLEDICKTPAAKSACCKVLWSYTA